MKTYTVDEAASIVHCHPETLREHIRAGTLAASKIGRAYCIRQSKLDEFLANSENSTGDIPSCPEEKAIKASTSVMAFGTLTSQRQAARELDNLLKPKTKDRRKNYMTS